MIREHGGLGNLSGKILDFSVNVNPLKYKGKNLKNLKDLLIKHIDSVFYYPDEKNEDLLNSAADYLQIKKENIILGNGTSELIYLIAHTFNPETALIPAPTFSEYERAMNAVNAKTYFLNLEKDFEFPVHKARKFKKDIIFLCNPNNPTGNLLNKKEILNLEKNFSIVVVDESFIEFSDNETIIHEVEGKNFIVLRSFSKFFGLPGLRFGCAVADKNIIKRLNTHLNSWNINSLASKIIPEILNDRKTIEEFKKRTLKFIDKERKFIINRLSKIPDVKVYNSVTNFLLIKIPFDSSVLVDKLFEKNIYVRDCKNFRNLGNNYIRIGIRTHKENEIFVNKFEEALNELRHK